MLIPLDQIVKRYRIKPKGAVHCGANIGEEREAYHKQGIEKVVWIEANPDLIGQLSANVVKYKHEIFNWCVSDTEGEEVNLHISNNAGQSSSILELGTHKIAHPSVHYIKDIAMKTQRLDSLPIKWDDYDFINMDLQCAELKALKGLGDRLSGFKWAYLEVNQQPLYEGCALVQEVDIYMLGFGFKRVETKWEGRTGWGDAYYAKK